MLGKAHILNMKKYTLILKEALNGWKEADTGFGKNPIMPLLNLIYRTPFYVQMEKLEY